MAMLDMPLISQNHTLSRKNNLIWGEGLGALEKTRALRAHTPRAPYTVHITSEAL